MPFGDRRGPLGMGPMTGRGAGYCSGYGMPGFANPVLCRGFYGFGRGWGRSHGWFGIGRGWRHRFWATGMPGWTGYGYSYGGLTAPHDTSLSTQEEMEMLKNQAEFLKRELDQIQNRISKIEKSQESEKE